MGSGSTKYNVSYLHLYLATPFTPLVLVAARATKLQYLVPICRPRDLGSEKDLSMRWTNLTLIKTQSTYKTIKDFVFFNFYSLYCRRELYPLLHYAATFVGLIAHCTTEFKLWCSNVHSIVRNE